MIDTNKPHGWIIGNGNRDKWRFIDHGCSSWTSDPLKALRFARREDAEQYCAEDEDAWCVIEISDLFPSQNTTLPRPRRIQMLKMVPAELAILTATDAVEEMGGDVRLTDAVVLLGKARNKVADYVDGEIGRAHV